MSLLQKDYEGFQRYCAFHRMRCRLTYDEVARIVDALVDKVEGRWVLDAAYGANCDVLAGVPANEAIRINVERYLRND